MWQNMAVYKFRRNSNHVSLITLMLYIYISKLYRNVEKKYFSCPFAFNIGVPAEIANY